MTLTNQRGSKAIEHACHMAGAGMAAVVYNRAHNTPCNCFPISPFSLSCIQLRNRLQPAQ
jgi:hypothetical protein